MLVCDLAASPAQVVAFPKDLGKVKVLAVSADGRFLATMKSEAAPALFDLAIHDARSGERLCEPEMSGGAAVHMATFSPDGTRLYAVMINGRMAAWPVAAPAPLWVTEGHASGTDSVAVFEAGRALVTQGRDDMTRFWDAATGGEIFAAPWRGRAVHASPAGDRIMMELADNLASVVMEFKPAAACATVEVPLSSTPQYNTFDQGRSSLAFSPDGTRLVVTTGHNVFQVARADGERWQFMEGSEIQCGRSGDLVPDFAGGSILQAAVGGVRRLPLVGGSVADGESPAAWEIQSPEVLPWFVVDATGRNIFAWHQNWHGFREVGRPEAAPGAVPHDGALTQCAAFAGDGRLVWVGQSVPLAGAPWELRRLRPDGGRIPADEPLAFIPAEERPQAMVVSADDRSILVLTDKALRSLSRDGAVLWQIPCHNRPPASAAGLAVGAGAHLVAATLRPEVVTLLDLRTGDVLLDLRRHEGGAIRALALSPDGRTLVVLSGRQADFWDLDVLRDHGALASAGRAR
jgi:dipeptidyl aminopeptidase/acylaminoacyl peptidase